MLSCVLIVRSRIASPLEELKALLKRTTYVEHALHKLDDRAGNPQEENTASRAIKHDQDDEPLQFMLDDDENVGLSLTRPAPKQKSPLGTAKATHRPDFRRSGNPARCCLLVQHVPTFMWTLFCQPDLVGMSRPRQGCIRIAQSSLV